MITGIQVDIDHTNVHTSSMHTGMYICGSASHRNDDSTSSSSSGSFQGSSWMLHTIYTKTASYVPTLKVQLEPQVEANLEGT